MKKSMVLGILSMIFGIISFLFCCCYGSGIVFSIAAIVLAVISFKKEKVNGFSIAGLILGIVGTIACFTMIVMFIVAAIKGEETPLEKAVAENSSEAVSEIASEINSEPEEEILIDIRCIVENSILFCQKY